MEHEAIALIAGGVVTMIVAVWLASKGYGKTVVGAASRSCRKAIGAFTRTIKRKH